MPSAFHLEGVKRGAVAGQLRHAARGFKVENTPSNIDKGRRDLNRIWMNEDAVKAEILHFEQPPGKSGKRRKIRSDAKIAVEIIATLPKELHGCSDTDLGKWVQATHAWIRENAPGRYLGAALHRDEKTPHIHYWMQPLTPEGRLNFSALYNKSTLINMHRAYDRALAPLGVVPNDPETKAALAEGYGGSWKTHQMAEAALKKERAAAERIEQADARAAAADARGAAADKRIDALDGQVQKLAAAVKGQAEVGRQQREDLREQNVLLEQAMAFIRAAVKWMDGAFRREHRRNPKAEPPPVAPNLRRAKKPRGGGGPSGP